MGIILWSLDIKIQNSVKRIAKEETIKIMTDRPARERPFVSNRPSEKNSLKINLVVQLRVKTNKVDNCTNVFCVT